jgi:hypothetical protein
MDDERIAQNQVTFRRVNEALEPGAAPPTERVKFLCECGRLGCTERIELDLAEYEAVRSDLNRFLLLPGHGAKIDVVLEHHGHYVVAAKEGVGETVAREDESRDDVLGA